MHWEVGKVVLNFGAKGTRGSQLLAALMTRGHVSHAGGSVGNKWLGEWGTGFRTLPGASSALSARVAPCVGEWLFVALGVVTRGDGSSL